MSQRQVFAKPFTRSHSNQETLPNKGRKKYNSYETINSIQTSPSCTCRIGPSHSPNACLLWASATGQAQTNTAYGDGALVSLTSGVWNSGFGFEALNHDTAGKDNTATGLRSLNTTGGNNTAAGDQALFSNTIGEFNTAMGTQALRNNTTASGNTAIGSDALFNNTGSGNIAVGTSAGFYVTTANNVICIGAYGNNVDKSCYIGQIFNATSSGGTAVFINPDGKLGTTTSSWRFKEDIKPMEHASEALFALIPVTFRYKKGIDPQGIPQFGLVAEDVEAVDPDLVVRDKEGKVNTVRYEAVNAMLLNEFLKEHRKVEEQEATIAELKSTTAKQEAIAAQQQKEIRALTASLKEQASQIRKVSDQLELNKPAPRTVLNDQ